MSQLSGETRPDELILSILSLFSVLQCIAVQPTKVETTRPGRRVGDSPAPYTYQEKRIVLECLLEFTPPKPCGQQFLNTVAKVSRGAVMWTQFVLYLPCVLECEIYTFSLQRLNRPASGLQTFISHRLRRELPRLLDDMYEGKYSRIGRSERNFIK